MRYADDFVVCQPDLEIVRRCQQLLQEWLRPLGLELKPSKTRIRHTLEPMEGETGFDFLGLTVRQFPAGRYHSGKNRRGNLLGFKTIITHPAGRRYNSTTDVWGTSSDRHGRGRKRR